jgi:hypothetical protein
VGGLPQGTNGRVGAAARADAAWARPAAGAARAWARPEKAPAGVGEKFYRFWLVAVAVLLMLFLDVVSSCSCVSCEFVVVNPICVVNEMS